MVGEDCFFVFSTFVFYLDTPVQRNIEIHFFLFFWENGMGIWKKQFDK